MVSGFYKKLFNDDMFTPLKFYGGFPKIKENDLEQLAGCFSDVEIQRAIKSMGAFKASGSNGFQPIFYHTQWEVVVKTLCKTLEDIFKDSRKMEGRKGRTTPSLNERFLFLHNIKTVKLSNWGETKKMYWKSILKGFREFTTFFLIIFISLQ